MQEEWDTDKGGRDLWVTWLADIFTEARRVLKPGGHALVWALPRTSHWTAYALENAGFDIRDSVHHVFGTGMPKSHDVSKAIDRAKGAQRKSIAPYRYANRKGGNHVNTYSGEWADRTTLQETAPATSEAQQWDGWGTGLKPAHETWWLARSPLSESTIAANVLRWGTGALNIDASRIAHNGRRSPVASDGRIHRTTQNTYGQATSGGTFDTTQGRWPANFLLSHSLFCQLVGTSRVKAHQHSGKPGHGQKSMFGLEMTGESRCYADPDGLEEVEEWNCAPDCPVRLLNEQGGLRKRGIKKAGHRDGHHGMFHMPSGHTHEAEEGYASRYFARFHDNPDPLLSEEIVEEWNCAPDCPVRLLNEQGGLRKRGAKHPYPDKRYSTNTYGSDRTSGIQTYEAEEGYASRYFASFSYCAKPSRRERNAGCEGLEEKTKDNVYGNGFNSATKVVTDAQAINGVDRGLTTNNHPTVKAIELMRYLVRMITPPGGVVLDMFGGSGSTALACIEEGFDYLLIERDERYLPIIQARAAYAEKKGGAA